MTKREPRDIATAVSEDPHEVGVGHSIRITLHWSGNTTSTWAMSVEEAESLLAQLPGTIKEARNV